MKGLLPLGLLAFFFLELASIILVGQRLGVGLTLLLIVAGFLAGSAVIRAAGTGLVALLQRPPRDLRFATAAAASRFLLLLSGLLFILPGFLSDLLALVLLPPLVRNLIAAHLTRNVEARDFRAPRPGPVIEGEAVEIDGEIEAGDGHRR
ncbi:MAG: FxsA family protein [Rhizobiales bacterium]|nr:FxsA family protein [Hyphomicrobiales bacterium]MBI3674630.1 FxsA family protein [Hyphomicrobiales bacterium]